MDMTKPRMTAEEAREAVAAYNPETDYRYWQQMAKVWTQAAHDMEEIARELTRDGKASEVARRLTAELSGRNAQEEGAKRSAVEEFAKTARDLVIDSKFAAYHDAVHQQNVETNAELSRIRSENEARLKAQRDAQYEKDLKDAELRREGKLPVKPAYM